MTNGIDASALDFSGKRVLVTGAAGGIGSAMAKSFAAHGATVVLADLDAEAVALLADELGEDVAWHAYDQADAASIQALADAVEAVDVLLNNAGILIAKPMQEHTPDEISRVITVNLIGPMLLANQIAAGMIARRSGVIVNTASQLAFVGAGGRGVYTTAKAGIVQFTKSAAAEWAPHGVRVVALAPGRTLTPMTSHLLGTADQREAGLAQIPYGRYGAPEEMGRLALFLASDLADYVVGETLIADGGYVVAG